VRVGRIKVRVSWVREFIMAVRVEREEKAERLWPLSTADMRQIHHS
jgi:hypothetical protein